MPAASVPSTVAAGRPTLGPTPGRSAAIASAGAVSASTKSTKRSIGARRLSSGRAGVVAVVVGVTVPACNMSIIEYQAMQFCFIDKGNGIEQRLAGGPAGSRDDENLSRNLLEGAGLARDEQRRGIEQHEPPRMARGEAPRDLRHPGAGDELRGGAFGRPAGRQQLEPLQIRPEDERLDVE